MKPSPSATAALVVVVLLALTVLLIRRYASRSRRCTASGSADPWSRCECGTLILAEAAVAPDREIPGLLAALECVLSLDDRDAGQLVQRARAAVEQ